MGWFKIALSGLIRSVAKVYKYFFEKPAAPRPDAAGNRAVIEEKARMKKKEQRQKEKAKKAKAKEDLKLVVHGAKIQCLLCTSPMGTLLVTSDRPTIHNKMIATIDDKSKANLLFTGTCMKSPNAASPCAAVMQVGQWKDTGSLKVQDASPLLQKSKIKCMFGNTDITFMHCGQSNPFTYDIPASPKAEVKEKADLVISLFFDGTRNNMKNTEAREEYFKLNGISPFEDPKWKKSANTTKAGYYETIGDKKADSYENGYSNVALLSKHYIKSLKDPENLDDFAYIEGIATGSKETDAYVSDSSYGYMFGQGDTGIEAKVEKGCQFAADKIKKLLPKGKVNEVIVINVFGFSRGAAAARSFLNEIDQAAKPARTEYYQTSQYTHTTINYPALPKHGVLGSELEKKNVDVTNTRIRIRFAGVFDTVSSHGLIKSNDAKTLGLTAVKKAKKTLHLVAADEHRYFFPLVNINSAGFNEKTFPGVHSDIGGSYVDNAPEHKKALAMGLSTVVESKYKMLVRDGWYKKNQLKIEKPNAPIRWYDPVRTTIDVVKEEVLQHLTGDKKSISVAYSYIPLYIMCDYAMQKGIWVNFLTDSLKGSYNINKHNKLEGIKKRLYKIVFEHAPEMKFYTRKELEKEIEAIRPSGPKKEQYGTVTSWVLDKLEDLEPEAGTPIELEAFITDAELKRKIEDHNTLLWLRNEYLHWSADWLEPGFHPTVSGNREIYNG